LKDKLRIAKINEMIGTLHTDLGKIKFADNYFKKSITIYQETGHRTGIRSILIAQSLNAMKRHDNQTAIKILNHVLSSFESINDNYVKCTIHSNLGIANYRLGNYMIALGNFKLQKKYAVLSKNNREIMISKGYISLVYEKKGNYTKALRGYMECLEEAMKSVDAVQTSLYYNNIGEIYLLKRQYKKSLEFFSNAEKISRKISYKYRLCYVLMDKAKALYSLKKFAESTLCTREVKEIAKKIKRLDVIFETGLLEMKLSAINDRHQTKKIMSSLLKKSTNEEQEANIKYAYYTISKEYSFREDALVLYKKIYLRKPDRIFKDRIEELEKGS
ncbi:tetratricopeptide repeat protein, partial [candidate division WOR-3 bacterium]|nr:tetratricopeptide repeat protein [candidate division WOR-3 bacterium]